VIIVFKF
jgi:RuvB-like protein 2